MVIVGGGHEAGEFKIIPWEDVAMPASGEMVWREVAADTSENNKGRYRYDGVVFEPPVMSRFRPQFPVFIKSVALHR